MADKFSVKKREAKRAYCVSAVNGEIVIELEAPGDEAQARAVAEFLNRHVRDITAATDSIKIVASENGIVTGKKMIEGGRMSLLRGGSGSEVDNG